MKYFFLFLILFFTINQSKSLQSSDFCRRNHHNKCDYYECGTFFCSFNKVACNSLITWTKKLNKNLNSQVSKKFIDSIKYCKPKLIHRIIHRLFVG